MPLHLLYLNLFVHYHHHHSYLLILSIADVLHDDVIWVIFFLENQIIQHKFSLKVLIPSTRQEPSATKPFLSSVDLKARFFRFCRPQRTFLSGSVEHLVIF